MMGFVNDFDDKIEGLSQSYRGQKLNNAKKVMVLFNEKYTSVLEYLISDVKATFVDV